MNVPLCVTETKKKICVCRHLLQAWQTNCVRDRLGRQLTWFFSVFTKIPLNLSQSYSSLCVFWGGFFSCGETLCDIRGGRQGQAFPPLKLQRKLHHQPPSFWVWTTLHCSLSGTVFACAIAVRRPSFSMRARTDADQESESERGRMEGMNLQRGHNWDAEPGLTCTSWTTDWTHWHRQDIFFLLLFRVIHKINISFAYMYTILSVKVLKLLNYLVFLKLQIRKMEFTIILNIEVGTLKF